jgi:protein involved in temperature-dependent protein secretion
MTARDKRTSPRVQPFVMRCRLSFAGRTATGYLTDLSVRGARVYVQDQPPAAGARLEIEVRFRHTSRHSRLGAEVKWTRLADDGRGHRVGVRFLGLGRDERALLDHVVEEFHAQAARIG